VPSPWQWLIGKLTPKETKPAKPGDAGDPPEAATPSARLAAHYAATIDRIRTSAKASAAAISGLGTAGLTALAIGKFADIFPLVDPSAADWIAAVAAVAGFALVAGAIAFFTIRLWKIDSPVYLPLRESEVAHDSEEWKTGKLGERYGETARLNGAASLEVYAARGRRFERVAAGLPADDPRRGRLAAQAQEIRDDIDATMGLVAVDVVRARAASVLTGVWTAALVVAFVAGLGAVALAADYLDGERTGKVTIAKECAAAGKALQDQLVATRELPGVCGAAPAASEPDPQAIAVANACAATAKALADQGLDVEELIGTECPVKEEDEDDDGEAPTGVDAVTIALLDRAKECETEQQEPAACNRIHALIRTWRKRQAAAEGEDPG
jgi:hypothetical protein